MISVLETWNLQLDSHIEFTPTLIDSTYIRLELRCVSVKWCAVGFGDSMTNADIILLRQLSQGLVEIRD